MSKINLLKSWCFFVLTMFMIQACVATNNQEENSFIRDSAITANVKSKIINDPTLSIYAIKVTTANGIVYLSGRVDSSKQAEKLITLVESTPGVTDVDTSNLHVIGSRQLLTDTIITSKIKSLFIREKLFGDTNVPVMSINVETNNGTVYLSGTANTNKQVEDAVRIARSVPGVKKVLYDIRLR